MINSTMVTSSSPSRPLARWDPRQDLRARAEPQGFGFGSFTVDEATGNLTISGKLADGSVLTGGTFIGQAGQVLLYQPLYANRSSCLGSLTVTAGSLAPANNTLAGVQVTWMKPAPLAGSKDLVYRGGFGPIAVDVAGGTYTPPSAGLLVMGLLPPVSPATTNAKLAFTLGGLETAMPTSLEFNQPVLIANPKPLTGLTNTATMVAPFFNSTAMPTLNAANGQFSGSFIVPGTSSLLNRPASFFGQIVTTATAAAQGYGYFLLPQVPAGTETVKTVPQLSGRVELKVP